MKLKPLEYALYLLKIRDRSVGEIKNKMLVRKCSKEEIDEVILFLNDKKFLDDEKFAANFVRNQLSIKPQGKYKLEQRLKQLYVDEKIIKDVLGKIDINEERNSAKELAKRWLRKHTDNSIQITEDKKAREKLLRHLMGRGFSYDIIKEVLTKIEH
ncbi:MAG: regulatory protein RecX [Patescibacteria group bacterium]